jgi:hypothetical protein
MHVSQGGVEHMVFTTIGSNGSKPPSLIFDVNVEMIQADKIDATQDFSVKSLSRTLQGHGRVQKSQFGIRWFNLMRRESKYELQCGKKQNCAVLDATPTHDVSV